MGAGKDAPPPATDGAAAPAPPQPVVLRMVLHCDGCAKKVKKSIHRMPGVVSVVADAAANTVVVAGTADAAALKARIESRTKKPVEIVSAGAAPSKPPPPAADPKKHPDKGAGADSKGDKAGAESPPREEKKQPQPPEEKKPVQDATALLRIRLHCDSCADRIRRRIYKIKGVKDVILEGNAKDEVKVVGTMDVPAMVAYLNDKLNRTVEAVAPGSKPGGDDAKDKGGDGDGHIKKDKAAGDDAHKADKGKGIEVAGPSVASAAASLAPAPMGASTHHVSPYGYGNVAYPPPQQGPPPGYYGGGNADGAGYATPYYQQPRADGAGYATPYYEQPRGDAGGYYQQQPRGDAGGYYQHQPRGDSYYHQPPSADGGSYYQHPGGYDQHPNPPPYQPYPFDTAPPPQMFSDENPNSCSVM
ncbi:heavy metal-associated isoprenylated plant protein 6-like [Lolium rigidum]|uniref:heavy metal-associated isoprenylated plant protein 6-like n=1 Tax=Lolium rigidum TaxID=89674 RepID=UPI001F5D8824|nr:heavy metal-associated isoprenylated plant protein 6-like [Lolium rigidum]